MSTDLIQKIKETYPDDGLRDYVRTKAVKAAAKKYVYYSTLFRDNNITDYSQYRPIDITRKIKELWDLKGEDYVPDDEEYNKIIYLNDKQKSTLNKNYEKEKEKLQIRERVKEEKKEQKEKKEKEKKPRGRPKKDNVIEDNNEQNKIEGNSTSSDIVENEIIMEQPNTEIKSKTTIKEEEKERKRKEKEEKKRIKEAEKQAAKELKKAERERKKQEKEAEKQANKKKPGRPKKTTNIYVSDSDDNKEQETEKEKEKEEEKEEEEEEIIENDDYLEEEVTVKMMEVDGKMYYYDINDVLYDISTHEELGKIDELFPGYKKE